MITAMQTVGSHGKQPLTMTKAPCVHTQ